MKITARPPYRDIEIHQLKWTVKLNKFQQKNVSRGFRIGSIITVFISSGRIKLSLTLNCNGNRKTFMRYVNCAQMRPHADDIK